MTLSADGRWAALFDLDGTLTDSARFHARSWELLADELGLDLPDDFFKRTFGKANRDILPELLGRDLSDDEIRRFSDRKEHYFRQAAGDQLPLFDGSRALLEGLHQAGWRIGIGSSTPQSNIDFALDLLDLRPLIEATVAMDDVERHKPEPDTFLRLAELLGVPPARCLVFEDAPAGIEAGNRAGMITVAVTTQHPADKLSHATAIRDGLWAITPDDCAAWLTLPAAANGSDS